MFAGSFGCGKPSSVTRFLEASCLITRQIRRKCNQTSHTWSLGTLSPDDLPTWCKSLIIFIDMAYCLLERSDVLVYKHNGMKLFHGPSWTPCKQLHYMPRSSRSIFAPEKPQIWNHDGSTSLVATGPYPRGCFDGQFRRLEARCTHPCL